MSELKIIGNHHHIDLLDYHELTDKERKEFDWYDAENGGLDFFRYRGSVYCVTEFTRTDTPNCPFVGYDGYASDSFFSGVLIRWCDDYERVQAYLYLS